MLGLLFICVLVFALLTRFYFDYRDPKEVDDGNDDDCAEDDDESAGDDDGEKGRKLK